MSIATSQIRPDVAEDARGLTRRFARANRRATQPESPTTGNGNHERAFDRDSNSPSSSAWESSKSYSDFSENEEAHPSSPRSAPASLAMIPAPTDICHSRSLSLEYSPRNRSAKRARVEGIVASMRNKPTLARSAPTSPADVPKEAKRQRTLTEYSNLDSKFDAEIQRARDARSEPQIRFGDLEENNKQSSTDTRMPNDCSPRLETPHIYGAGYQRLAHAESSEHRVPMPNDITSLLSREEAMFVAAFKQEVANVVKNAVEESALRILKTLSADGIFPRYQRAGQFDFVSSVGPSRDRDLLQLDENSDPTGDKNQVKFSNREQKGAKDTPKQGLAIQTPEAYGPIRESSTSDIERQNTPDTSRKVQEEELTHGKEEESNRGRDLRSSSENARFFPNPVSSSTMPPFFPCASTLRNFQTNLANLHPLAIPPSLLANSNHAATTAVPAALAQFPGAIGRSAFHTRMSNSSHDAIAKNRLQLGNPSPLFYPLSNLPLPTPLAMHPPTFPSFNYPVQKRVKLPSYDPVLLGEIHERERKEFRDHISHQQAKKNFEQEVDGSHYPFQGNAQEGLTPQHLKKAKLIFFYTRYPSANTLKTCFPDVKFTRAITSQIIKWFSNFREFFYIQMEKFARQSLSQGVTDPSALNLSRDSDLFRVLNLHYNKSSDFRVPEGFIQASEASLREFFAAVKDGRDCDPAWKKVIYKVICKLDREIPELFKSPNVLENLHLIRD